MDSEETGSYFSTVILCFSVPNSFWLWPLTLSCCTVARLKTMCIYIHMPNSTPFITTKCGKFLKRWEYHNTLHASWEICRQVKKKQLILIRSHLFIFAFISNILPMFSSRSFIVSGLTFRFLIRFEFIFVHGVRKCSSFICFISSPSLTHTS